MSTKKKNFGILLKRIKLKNKTPISNTETYILKKSGKFIVTLSELEILKIRLDKKILELSADINKLYKEKDKLEKKLNAVIDFIDIPCIVDPVNYLKNIEADKNCIMFQLMVHKEVTNKLRNDYNRMAEIFLKLESEKRSHFEEVNVFINNKSLEFIFNNPDTSINCEWLKEEYEGFITKNKDFERICGREFTDIWNANTISFLQYLDANSKMFEAALIQVKKTGNDYKCRPELWLAEN